MTERTTMTSNAEGAYLRAVSKRLQSLTAEQRDAVLDDVRAHFADAADAGRSPEQAAESLGDPAKFSERVRAELGHEPGRADHVRRVLQWLATGVAVFTMMFISFWFPDQDSLPGVDAQVEQHGFGIMLWNLVPALIALLPVLVPTRVRTVATAASAILLTALCLTGLYNSSWFVPTALLAWAALVTPAVARDGRPAAGWRVTGGVLTALPATLVLVGLLTGSFDLDVWGVLLTVASFALGVLVALGRPRAGIILAVGGVALLVQSALSPGYIVLATWWAGGLLLTVGASHALAHARSRGPARAKALRSSREG
ncbi:hypothetical protein GCM10027063_49000 [Promicromonospora xylanilytica]